MIIEKIRRPAADGGTRVECEVKLETGRKDTHRIFASTEPPHTLEADPNGFLLGAFVPALTAGEPRIRIEGAVCPLLAANLSIAAGMLRTWWKNLPAPPVIECDYEYRSPGTKSAAFLSGGVDSLAMVRNLTRLKPPGHPDRPSAAVVVDFPELVGISRAESDARFARSTASARGACADIGLDVIPVKSNFCRLNGEMTFWMYRYHGSFLASMAHFLGREYRAFHIAASYPAAYLKPYGSHPQLDPFYSSQHVRIAHELIELTRLQRTAVLGDWPAALDRLYVCNSMTSNGENCGSCEKCVRTRLHLVAIGKLAEAGAFRGSDLGVGELLAIRPWTYPQRMCYEDVLPGLRRLGRHDLVAACQRLVSEYDRAEKGAGPLKSVALTWRRRGGWLGAHLSGSSVPNAPRKQHIEAVAEATNKLGPQKLAEEYGEPGGKRTPAIVRSSSSSGDLYAWLVQRRRPATIVEFGAAFGVSGMYFAAGLEAANCGHLYSFEINRGWADIAERNIRAISSRFTLTRGSFEDKVGDVIAGPIDIAFVDAIHQYDFVMRQFGILRPRMAPGAIILFDDIDFPKPGARMREAWRELAQRPDVVAAVEFHGQLGILELAGMQASSTPISRGRAG